MAFVDSNRHQSEYAGITQLLGARACPPGPGSSIFDTAQGAPPRVVIVGAGFGGLAAAQALARSPVKVVLVDKNNHHLFQPFLYQVATAALSPAQIATPIRSLVRRQCNASVLLGRVDGVDTANKVVFVDGQRLSYDYLVVATGARHAYFGRDEWERHAPGLKSIGDAIAVRERILLAFERAEIEPDEERRRSLLNFVVVGGGPTGVEMAGAIAELAKKAIAQDFRNIDPRAARIVLVEGGPRLLCTFPERLSEKAHRSLEALGVEVKLGQAVSDCDGEGVIVGDERIAARTVIWAAGIVSSPAAEWLNAAADRLGRVRVEPDLSIPGRPEIFVVGDAAHVEGPEGKLVPGLAPAAKQQGRFVGQLIGARLRGRAEPARFRYRHFGDLAMIGRRSAVVSFGWLRLSGWPAWVLWGLAHVFYLSGLHNRFTVILSWAWSYATFHRGSRLITGSLGSSSAPRRNYGQVHVLQPGE